MTLVTLLMLLTPQGVWWHESTHPDAATCEEASVAIVQHLPEGWTTYCSLAEMKVTRPRARSKD